MIAPNWLKIKRYPHIGLPIHNKEIKKVCSYVTNPEKIAHHAFLPLIRREIVTHPWRVDEETMIKKKIPKIRPITYSSHLDSVIYSYYAFLLQKKYEDFVYKNGLQDVAVAYRKIPVGNNKGNKCNIHIANDVFNYVKKQLAKGLEVALITFDIKSFFDELDHKRIKQTWKQMLGRSDLPKDVYNVYKSATHFSYITERDLFDLFKDNIICERSTGDRKCKVKSLKYLRNKRAIAFCKKDDMSVIRASHRLVTNNKGVGIPQGLPISAVLANVYMCDFDLEVASKARSEGVMYKRYSDDIVIVCPITLGRQWKDYIIERIQKEKLEIQPHKTNLFYLKIIDGEVVCQHETKGTNKRVEYLGFSFDGRRILLKDSGLGKYYQKMWRAKRRHKRWAIDINNNTNGQVFVHGFVKRYTLAGTKRHYVRDKKKGFSITERKQYGNYLTYVLKASEIMKSDCIYHQLRRNKNKVAQSIQEIHDDVRKVMIAKQRSTQKK